jgi:hypothetical protein
LFNQLGKSSSFGREGTRVLFVSPTNIKVNFNIKGVFPRKRIVNIMPVVLRLYLFSLPNHSNSRGIDKKGYTQESSG